MATANPPELPDAMRAYAHTTAGKPQDVLSLTELPLPPLPKPGSNDVLVRVSHATICFGGTFMIFLTPSFFTDRPLIPHYEFSGTVVAVDPEGHRSPPDPPLSVGTPVFGTVPIGRTLKRAAGAAAPSGALAEYVLVPGASLVRKPDALPFDQAAGIAGVSSGTALTLAKHAKIKAGNKVLVYGASGSVGTFAVQLAREAAGPSGRVVAVCGPSGRDSVINLGASEVIDRHDNAPVHEHLAERFKGDAFDVILDAFGAAELFTHCEPYLKEDGVFVTVGVAFKKWTLWSAIAAVLTTVKQAYLPTILGGTPRKLIHIFKEETPEVLEAIRRLAAEGKLRTQIDSTHDMGDITEAYDRVMSRKTVGKVIVRVQKP